MSKIAIIGDIHGNAEAFEAVLGLCEELGVDSYVSLGDIVGYNADPALCLQAVQALNPIAIVRGNHDEYTASSDEAMEGFNTNARLAIRWTREQLTAEERQWLGNLPMQQTLLDHPISLVHATLDSPNTWGYVFDVYHAMDNFSYQLTQLCFCGHSHVPAAFCKPPFGTGPLHGIREVTDWVMGPDGLPCADFNAENSFTVAIEPGCKYLFNIGSVGQPRNHDPRASFAVYDSMAQTVTRYAIPYDIATAQEKVRAAGLPERLAARLALGQ